MGWDQNCARQEKNKNKKETGQLFKQEHLGDNVPYYHTLQHFLFFSWESNFKLNKTIKHMETQFFPSKKRQASVVINSHNIIKL